MDRTATKEAAEALLRELPSVVGAYVLEDVYGHPREIHVLIHAGPSARHFARDVRDMLEDRLGVPVDQRVISIAQLAGDPADGAADDSAPAAAADRGEASAAASSEGARDPAEPNRTAAPATPRAAAGTDAPSTPPPPPAPGPAPRLLLEGTSIERSDGRLAVHVRLRIGGELFEGVDTQIDTPHALLRGGANALLDAASHAARGGGRFTLEDAAIVRAIGRDYVLLTVHAHAPQLGRRPLVLAGAHAADEETEVAAALAALKAINRVFARLGARTEV